MTDIEFEEWMSDSDALLWHIERDPLLRSTVTSVWLLDSTPARASMDAVVEHMVGHVPRLRQRVIDDRSGIATPRWEDDPYFDTSYHYRWVRLAGRSPRRRDVLDHARHVASRAFDKDRPLWGLQVVEGLKKSRAALVLTVHHAIADGLGLVNLLQHMVELEPGHGPPALGEPAPTARTPTETSLPAAGRSVTRRVSEETRSGLRLGRATMRTAAGLVRDPIGTLRTAARTTTSVAGVVKPTPHPLSPLMTERSMSPVFETLTVPLDLLRAAAKTAGATINDAFVSAVLDALDRYHRHHGVEADEIRMAMPVSVRTDESAGLTSNQFVPARFVLPLGDASPADRLADTHSRLRAIKGEPALPYVNDISGVIGRLGPAAAVTLIGGMMKGVDVTTSNVPGPPFPVWVAGAAVERFFAFGPTAGAAVNITLFSYDGVAHVAVNLDARAVPDAERFVAFLEASVEDMLALAGADDG